jgi:hypothetical protein
MGVAVDHDHRLEAREDRLDLLGVVGPEVPGLVQLVERRVREDDHGPVRGHALQVLGEPLALFVADAEGALHSVVEPGHRLHPLLGRQLSRCPEILLDHAVQHHEVDALVLERIRGLAEQLAPLLAHVEVPIVLADHHAQRRLDVLQDLGAERELAGLAELRQVAPVEHEVGLRIHAVDVVHGPQQLVDEAVVELAFVEVRVGDIGEGEGRLAVFGGLRDPHGLEGVRRQQTLRCRCSERGRRHLHERAPIEAFQGPVQLGALGHMARLDARGVGTSSTVGHWVRPFSSRSKGSTSRWVRLVSRKGRRSAAMAF